MRQTYLVVLAALLGSGLHHGAPAAQSPAAASAADRASCEALQHLRNLTITHAGLSEAGDGVPYCYVKGILPPAIQFHVQLPLAANWNGRFLKWGDGGKDGDLDFADHRVVEGYAVANSNTGHDNGAEPGSSFAYDNRQAEIDFGYRAVHLTVAAAKTVVRAYYGDTPAYSYFEGCSTGGRQGLMEAQRYPTDFDGIVAGAPANHYQEMNAVRVWLLQRMFRDDFAGALAFDADGDGRFDSVRKLDILADAVLAPKATPVSHRRRYGRSPTFMPGRATVEARRSTPASRSVRSGSGPVCSSPIPATDSPPARWGSAATTSTTCSTRQIPVCRPPICSTRPRRPTARAHRRSGPGGSSTSTT